MRTGADVVRVRHTILHEPHRRGLEFAIGLFEAGGEIGERPVLGGGAFAIDDREKCLHRAAAILGELAADKVHRLDAVGAFIDHGDRSEEHTSELQSLMRISYAVFCLKKKNKKK